MESLLSESVQIKKISETSKKGVFEIEGLYTGYGLTMGNALRRALLSSLEGAAITQVKIKNVNHEFSTLPGVMEDILEITLNLKDVKLRVFSEEPQVLLLKSKGEGQVFARDIKVNSEVEIITPNTLIATLTEKGAELDMELTVSRGLGYSPVDSRKVEKLGVGTIALDALFSPVLLVNYNVSNMRVGERTDYNRLNIEIETDGTKSPSQALSEAVSILNDHFSKIKEFEVTSFDSQVLTESPVKKSKKNK